MENCLVTKLKENVNNDNLLKAGEFRVNVYAEENPVYSYRVIETLSKNGVTFKVVSGDLYFTDSTGAQNLGTEITGNSVYLSNSDGVVSIMSKYDITLFQLSNDNRHYVELDVSDLSYLGSNTNAAVIYINNMRGRVRGNIANLILDKPIATIDISRNNYLSGSLPASLRVVDSFLSFNTQIEATTSQLSSLGAVTYRVQNNLSISGNIANLAQINLETAVLDTTSVTGTVESLFEAMWSLNLRDNSVSVRHNSLVSFHDVIFTEQRTLVGEYAAGGITVKEGGNTIATYDGTSWTYAN